MVRIVVTAWVMVLVASAAGGVWAAERLSAEPCVAAAAIDLAPSDRGRELPPASGRIVKVDGQSGRVTIAHGAIGHYYIEPGTSVFYARDASQLVGLSAGDKIRFDVARDGRRFAITRLEHSN